MKASFLWHEIRLSQSQICACNREMSPLNEVSNYTLSLKFFFYVLKMEMARLLWQKQIFWYTILIWLVLAVMSFSSNTGFAFMITETLLKILIILFSSLRMKWTQWTMVLTNTLKNHYFQTDSMHFHFPGIVIMIFSLK